MMITYRTLSDAINQLAERGFASSFKFVDGQLQCLESGKKYRPEDLEIVEFHRFEGESNPSDMSIVFAVQCKGGDKGTIVSSYGIYASEGLLEFMDSVKIADRNEAAGTIRKRTYY